MRARELDLRELLDFAPRGGVLRFAGQRALILDAVALGLLRTELIETLGLAGARGILTRFGYAHGWRTADTLRHAIKWDDEREWRTAGGRLHQLQGMVVFEPVAPRAGGPFAESVWHQSYEAEQHVLHFGVSDEPVCWTLAGFASGYLSFTSGRDIICFEERCLGRGDAVCRMVAREKDEWAERGGELAYYDKGCLEASLGRVTDTLKRTEQKLRRRRQELARAGASAVEDASGLTARSAAMKRVLDVARRVARVDATVLVTGESGVGKERLARLVHDESARAGRAFVAVNCSAVPETLLESELFGHARGAFTGATGERVGLFEAASGGTLFLDEIGEVPLSMQVKLLRALQEREVRRVGENKNRKVDVRVVAATNRELAAEVAAGRFRQDLYYRLRVVEIQIPPLRERRDDILPLARALLAQAASGGGPSGFSQDAAQRLLGYAWPGNVRELSNAIQRAVALADGGRIDVDDLPEEVRTSPARSGRGARSLEDVERDYILEVLKKNAGNRTRTAAELRIGPATLFRKLRQYGELQ
jgi:two-component system, NtrC family, response regulator HydG